MRNKKVGIYVHIPFCARKCPYCDFCSFEGSSAEEREAYTAALCREIASYREALADYTADTVYFGGGTPSMLAAEQTERVLRAICSAVPLAPDAEITSEVNPATADAEKLRAWRGMGINRLSVGVQSFCDTELAALGRLHTAGQAQDFLSLAGTCGFDNVSLDLMYAIPTETPETLGTTLSRAIETGVKHISAYSLKIEDGTPFAAMRRKLILPDEDAEADLYAQCIDTLAQAGYRHYEISNYALPGYECRHNLRYWRMEEYIGVGVAAYSFFDGKRYGCDRDLAAYLHRDFTKPPISGTPLTPAQREYETVMLALRLREGIEEEAFRRAFGYGFFEKYGRRLAPFLTHGLAARDGTRTYLTDRGLYVSLGVLAEILDDPA